MAGIDNALAYVEKDGDRAMDRFQKHMKETRKALRRCRHLKFLPEDGRQDPGKLLISVKGTVPVPGCSQRNGIRTGPEDLLLPPEEVLRAFPKSSVNLQKGLRHPAERFRGP